MRPEEGVIRVRTLTHEFVTALEAAAVSLGQKSRPDEINEAYSTLNGVRQALYTELAALERKAGITNQPVKLRF